MVKSFILMIQFFTRIPIPIVVPTNPKVFRKAVVFLPFVGVIIGAIIGALYLLLDSYINSFTLSVIVVIIEIIITGGLHLDGLADTFDGLYSAQKRERMLEIMRDSYIGTYGVSALIMTLMLKVSLIYSVDSLNKFYVLLAMPIISRCGVVFLGYRFNYARENGLGNWMIGNVQIYHVITSVLITVGMIYFLFNNWMLACLLIMLAIFFAEVYGNHVKKYIGGITGDTLGSYIELMEVLYLIFIVTAGRVFII